jgi:hypothetical protein
VSPQAPTYFAYGSNLNRAHMSVRRPSAKPLGRATLPGWRLTFRGVADIERAVGAVVQGGLWLLRDADVRALDRYEGAPALYRRRSVAVVSDGELPEAMTYVMVADEYLGLPSTWYLGRIAAGYRDWALPLGPLRAAVERTAHDLAERGTVGFAPDGRKRLRAVLEDRP